MTVHASRRRFIAGAAAALVAPFASASRARAIDPIPRKRPSHLKLSIAAYSYRDYLTGKKQPMDMFDYLDLAADMGLDAVEPTSYYFPADADPAYFSKFKQRAFMLGLDISGTAIGNNFCLPDGTDREKQITLAKTWIDRAADLDAPVIRIFAGTTPKGDKEEDAVARAIDGIREVLPYAASKGVTLALENHGGITATPQQLLKLVKAIEAPNFGVNLDTGNFRTEDPYGDLELIAPYAVNVQVKTEVQPKGKPKEDADLARLVGILRNAKYSGYVVLEYEADEDPLKAIPKHIESLKKLIKT